MKTIVNVETGEIVERDLTTEELQQSAIDQEKLEAKRNDFAAKSAAKAELLQHLGITEDQAKLLLS